MGLTPRSSASPRKVTALPGRESAKQQFFPSERDRCAHGWCWGQESFAQELKENVLGLVMFHVLGYSRLGGGTGKTI